MKQIKYTPYELTSNKSFHGIYVLKLGKSFFKNVDKRQGKQEISFDNCQFDSLIIESKEEIDFEKISISFSYCLIKRIEFIDPVQLGVSVDFHGCILEGKIKGSEVDSVTLNNSVTKSLMAIEVQHVGISITHENIFFLKWKEMLGFTNIKNIQELLQIKQNLHLNKCKSIQVFRSTPIEKKNKIYKEPGEIKEYNIRYNLTESELKKTNINLNISFYNDLDLTTTIRNFILNGLSMNGYSSGEINIENSKINQIFFHKFRSGIQFNLYNIKPWKNDSKFEISQCSLARTWFDNIDFNGYELLSFYRTKIGAAEFTSCNFPEKNIEFEKFKTLRNIHYQNLLSENFYKDQYEIFLQLKRSLETSGNYFEALKLEAISKEALKKVKTLPFRDKVILNVNGFSNNHGQNFALAIRGFIIFSIIFYIINLLILKRIFINTDFDWDLVSRFFVYIDPFNFSFASKETGWTLIINFVYRIISAFYIFQLISSFRKFTKK
jgi:hypothetical protein